MHSFRGKKCIDCVGTLDCRLCHDSVLDNSFDYTKLALCIQGNKKGKLLSILWR